MRQGRAKARWDLYQPEHARVLTRAPARAYELEQLQQREQEHE